MGPAALATPRCGWPLDRRWKPRHPAAHPIRWTVLNGLQPARWMLDETRWRREPAYGL